MADRLLGYQRSILLGAVIMGLGLFTITVPNQQIFVLGLALVIIGNGLFKPNISSMVGQLYAPGDPRRDRGFTIFYMGINLGGFVAPLVTGWLASVITEHAAAAELPHRVRRGRHRHAAQPISGSGSAAVSSARSAARRPGATARSTMFAVIAGAIVAVPIVYVLMSYVGAYWLAWLLGALFVVVAAMLHGRRRARGQRAIAIA